MCLCGALWDLVGAAFDIWDGSKNADGVKKLFVSLSVFFFFLIETCILELNGTGLNF